MGKCILPLEISALGCTIAETIPDDAQLTLLAAILTALGDTLATIAAARAVCAANSDRAEGTK